MSWRLVPDEEDVFERPGDVKSIPRDGKPKDDDSPEVVWQRDPIEMETGVPDEEDVFERPGDVKSIPRDGRSKDEVHPDMVWQRTPNCLPPGVPEEVARRPSTRTT
jgi:hypothetical protein